MRRYYKDAESAVRRQKERGRVALTDFVVLPFIPDDDDASSAGRMATSMSPKPGQPGHKQFNFMLKGAPTNISTLFTIKVRPVLLAGVPLNAA
jgi:hypothetical protein